MSLINCSDTNKKINGRVRKEVGGRKGEREREWRERDRERGKEREGEI